jgi:hypothetical protein
MRTLIAAALVALAGSAEAAPKHKWFIIDARNASCVTTDQTPEQFQAEAEGPEGHLQGVTAATIAPNDVTKDDAGNIRVTVRGTDQQGPVHWSFFTSREACDLAAKAMTPEQAPTGDIN